MEDSDYGTISGGTGNIVAYGSELGTIGGGYLNTVGEYASICGGASNTASGLESTVGGGVSNAASNTVDTVCGGGWNTASGAGSTVGGGLYNTASGAGSTVGGGVGNTASDADSTVSGGASNTALGSQSTVGGGASNTASSVYATVPGGYSNTAYGDDSFAAGSYAYANASGCFVWADAAIAENQQCTVQGYGTAVSNAFVVRAEGGFEFVTDTDGSGNPSAGVFLDPAMLSLGWQPISPPSDQYLKHDILEIDPRDVLERVISMPIATWRYNGKEPLHLGPMAQDFYAAFKLGNDDRHIDTIDEGGVALAAVQGLHYESLRKDEVINALGARVANLEQVNAEANRRVASLEKRLEQIAAQLELRK
jgi:hypothetical protein